MFNLPSGHDISGAWLRVSDEGDKITMSLKVIDGDAIENQKEICLEANSYEQTELLLEMTGCEKKAYQESKREIWSVDGVEIMIDEWLFLEPFVEIEGNSEESVKSVSEKLGFNYNDALFCSVARLYVRKYGIDKDVINNYTPFITFSEKKSFY